MSRVFRNAWIQPNQSSLDHAVHEDIAIIPGKVIRLDILPPGSDTCIDNHLFGLSFIECSRHWNTSSS